MRTLNPSDVLCLMEYFIFPRGSPDIHNRNSSAIEMLASEGLIEDNLDLREYEITDKGAAHVKHLLCLKFPINVWVLPDSVHSEQLKDSR